MPKTRRRQFLRGLSLLPATPLLLPVNAHAAFDTPGTPDSTLTRRLGEALDGFRGVAGVYARHLPSGRSAAFRADELFPTASMIKVAIMAALFDRISHGELAYHQYMEYTGQYDYTGTSDDILSSFRPGETIRLSKLIMLMISISDNSASIWNQVLAGTGTRINEVLAAHGFHDLRINSRTPGREEAYERYGWGQSTPREMCRLFALIRERKIVSAAASEEMYRILTRIFWSGEALSRIPPYVQAASKQGGLRRSRSETVLVNAPHGDYVFSVITKDQEDTSFENGNEGWQLIRNISGILWNYFEPDYGWEPAPVEGNREQ